MRKNSLFFLGTATGICLTLLFTAPQGAHLVEMARATAGGDIYSQLNLFGEVFERVRPVS
jgi:carboxyl-terminal processing protease